MSLKSAMSKSNHDVNNQKDGSKPANKSQKRVRIESSLSDEYGDDEEESLVNNSDIEALFGF